jgi:transcription antitermination factor NusG
MAVACQPVVIEHSGSALSPEIAAQAITDKLRREGGIEWYAIRTRPKHEKIAEAMLLGKGYESFLPVYSPPIRPRGRAGDIRFPLFPGYLFCKFNVYARLPILTTPGVLYIVGQGRIPVPVPDIEIDSVRRVVSSGMAPQACSYLEIGRRVYIQGGPLQGVVGRLVHVKNTHRLVVSINLLQRAVSLEIDRNWAAPDPGNSDPNCCPDDPAVYPQR